MRVHPIYGLVRDAGGVIPALGDLNAGNVARGCADFMVGELVTAGEILLMRYFCGSAIRGAAIVGGVVVRSVRDIPAAADIGAVPRP